MLRSIPRSLVLLLTLTGVGVAQASTPSASHYVIRATETSATDGEVPIDVEWTISDPPTPSMVVAIPVWTPGSYRLRTFPDQVREVRATVGSNEVPVERVRKDAWRVPTGDSKTATIRYRVFLRGDDRFMMRGEKRRALTYEGPQAYLYVRRHLNHPCHVRFELPDGWSTACGLEPRPDGTWFAPDYDTLTDCPVKIGKFQRFEFEAAKATIEVVVDGPGDIEFSYDVNDWLDRLRRIVETQAAIFGGLPLSRYSFLFTASPRGSGGGLEHLTSTCIGVSARALRSSPGTGIGTAAHEFFHLWNVKRIRPRELGPFDYSRPVRTTGLWLSEGVTSYYGTVTLHRMRTRAGEDVDTVATAFLKRLQGTLQSLEDNPARFHIGSTDASEQMWELKASDRFINYYGSGMALGFLLDLEIRAATDNRKSLDDFMRALSELCEEQGRGFDPDELWQVLGQIAGRPGFWRDWLDRHVDGVIPPDYARLGKAVGLDFDLKRAEPRPYLRGSRAMRVDGENRTWWTQPEFNDRRWPFDISRSQGFVTRVDDQKVSSFGSVSRAIRDRKDGDRVRLTLAGIDGRQRTVIGEVGTRRTTTLKIRRVENATPIQRAILNGIVTGEPGSTGR